ncbi:MAG: apolipoprotein N-acyltransferase [Candidatus Kentron sp. G]|nr:MAG: apolipoprotein N-acyltransferase [Candidatus Kentron sp. G]VFN03900.1 MAG: apolipoprotein N-acyltransferase [Candidatus Kentron sp. G]VFN04391.1 MAG: apolipoprotein N-acyltransferase [Candidatus Kentron sp. G]
MTGMHHRFFSRGRPWPLEARPVSGDAIALLAGLMMPFSFAPFGLYGLAAVALALLFRVLVGAAPGRGFRRGWIFGLGLFGVGVFWIHESFKFAAVALPLALALTGALVMVLALYPALFGFFVGLWTARRRAAARIPLRRNPITPVIPGNGPWISRRPHAKAAAQRVPAARPYLDLLLVLPAGWVLVEWARGWLLGGFPWLQIGYAHVDSPLAGFAPLLGVHGVGWAAAVSAGLVLLAFYLVTGTIVWPAFLRIGRRASRHTGRGLGSGLLVLSIMGGGLWGGGMVLGQVAWTTPTGAPVRAALIQGNIPQDIKWHPSRRQPILDRYLSLTRQARPRDLVVWPETALPGFYRDFPDVIARLRREARDHGTHTLLGVAFAEAETRRYFNSVAAIVGDGGGNGGGDGQDDRWDSGRGDAGDGGVHFYYKRHLVPFGEYLPMPGLLGGIMDFLKIPMSDFSPGPRAQAPLAAAGQEIGVSVCYEAAFGRDILPSLPEATLLVNVSNDAWFGDSLGPHQNLQMARLRAKETGRYLLRGTNTGISALIDPAGRVVDRAPQFQVSVLTGTVKGMTGATPYSRYGNRLAVLLALAALAAGVAIRRYVS